MAAYPKSARWRVTGWRHRFGAVDGGPCIGQLGRGHCQTRRGALRAAVADLREAIDLAVGHGMLVAWPYNVGFLALALLEQGSADEAAWGDPCASGASLRALGLVEGGKEGIGLLREAVEVHLTSAHRKLEISSRAQLGKALWSPAPSPAPTSA